MVRPHVDPQRCTTDEPDGTVHGIEAVRQLHGGGFLKGKGAGHRKQAHNMTSKARITPWWCQRECDASRQALNHHVEDVQGQYYGRELQNGWRQLPVFEKSAVWPWTPWVVFARGCAFISHVLPVPCFVQSLASKVALITGGISGLGHATALRFARQGAMVAMLDVAPPADVSVTIPGAIYVQADVRSEADVRAPTIAHCVVFRQPASFACWPNKCSCAGCPPSPALHLPLFAHTPVVWWRARSL
jgi:hypothetical protein